MKGKDPAPSEIAKRLALITSRHGQAVVARKTGTSRQNISRYLTGTKAPLEFGEALARNMGVNPAWLLTGEGSIYLSDVTANTAQTASGMLEMVRAMDAVSRVSLGELTGKEYAKTLRELNDSLQSYERMRAKLDLHARPLLQRITTDLETANLERRTDAGRELEMAGIHVSRFCHDLDLERRFDAARSQLHFRLANFETALNLSRNVFLRALNRKDRGWVPAAHMYVQSLRSYGHLREARRMCRTAVALLSDGPDLSPDRQIFLSMQGMLDVELGDLRNALILLAEASMYSDAPNDSKAYLFFAQCLSGGRSLDDAINLDTAPQQMLAVYNTFACWHESPVHLKRVVHATRKREQDLPAYASYPLDLSERILRALNGESDVPIREAPSGIPPSEAFKRSAAEAQVALLAGHKDASEWVERSCSELEALPEDVTPNVFHLARHHRNVLRAFADSKQKNRIDALAKARGFFQRHIEAGYRCFMAVMEINREP